MRRGEVEPAPCGFAVIYALRGLLAAVVRCEKVKNLSEVNCSSTRASLTFFERKNNEVITQYF